MEWIIGLYIVAFIVYVSVHLEPGGNTFPTSIKHLSFGAILAHLLFSPVTVPIIASILVFSWKPFQKFTFKVGDVVKYRHYFENYTVTEVGFERGEEFVFLKGIENGLTWSRISVSEVRKCSPLEEVLK